MLHAPPSCRMKVDTGVQGDWAYAVWAPEKVYSEIQERFHMSCDLLMLEPGKTP